jgi:hypothetical protein
LGARRLGHLVLFDDEQMIEPRFVVPVANHTISVYGGPNVDPVPEGELWIKRNAICLTPKPFLKINPDKEPVTYYIFSDDCSKKEDFYFALLQNQEKVVGSVETPPKPQQFDVENIVTLVKRLHSSEQQLQTRWVNALMGRLFLALYKTSFLEEHFRRKITKKISRVPKPTFITKLELQSIDLGEAAPFITNPRLKDLTVDGDCCVEADVKYAGNVRVVIAATARIDLGQRFKAREVDLVLAVVIRKLEGHALLRFKPPPSNRIWVTFEKMPDIEMKIEPIVSTRQVTYNIVLQAIEKRIRETFAESMVLPYWDDTPFYETYDQHFRGGIWEPSRIQNTKGSAQSTPEQEESDREMLHQGDRVMSMPVLPNSPSRGLKSRKAAQSTQALVDPDSAESSRLDKPTKPPRVIRSQSFAPAATPVATPNNANVEPDKTESNGRNTRSKADAAAILMAINKSIPPSPADTPIGSPPNEPVSISIGRGQSGSTSSGSSKDEKPLEVPSRSDTLNSQDSPPSTPKSADFRSSSKSSVASEESRRSSMLESVSRSLAPSDRKPTTTIGVATAAAKQWGWNVLNRREQNKKQNAVPAIDRAGTPENPIGRGRPLPPPGMPLPPPERTASKSSVSSTLIMPKRKPVPPPLLPARPQEPPRPIPNPPLPPRRISRGKELEESTSDEVLVVAAPPESDPTTPIEDPGVVRHMELGEVEEPADEKRTDEHDSQETPTPPEEQYHAEPEPERPMSSGISFMRGRLSSSPEEDGHTLPSWSTAEEEEYRSKSIWAHNLDNEHS